MTSQSTKFMQLVEGLRDDDDKYSLLVQGGAQHGLRIVLNEPELLLGWAPDGQLVFTQEEIEVPCLYLQKDWHGVSAQYLQPKKGAFEAQGKAFQLQQGAQLELGVPPKAARQATASVRLLFQQPVALQTLGLPPELPEPVRPAPAPAPRSMASQIVIAPPLPPAPPRQWFGYFSTQEMIFFALGTLVLTALLFLLFRAL